MKPKPTHRCQALDMSGRQCRRDALRTTQYHGDYEIYDHTSPEPRWVRVWLCDKHSEPRKVKR